MYKEFIKYILNIGIRHKAVYSAKYQKRMMINQQNSNAYMQFIIEEDPYIKSLSNGTLDCSLSIDILGQPSSKVSTVEIQSMAFQVGVDCIGFIEADPSMKNIMTVTDYDYLFLSEFTDDRSAGVRMTISFSLVNPLNQCTFKDNFVKNENIDYKEETDSEKIEKKESNNKLDINPIRFK